MSKTVYVTAGAEEYVGGTIVEVTGKDISSDTIVVGLGKDYYTPPTDWVSPSAKIISAANKVLVKLIVEDGVAPGRYWFWARITDSPEIVVLPVQGPIVVS